MEFRIIKRLSIVTAFAFLAGCGGEETPTIISANDSTITVVETADHALDSTLLAAYQNLNNQVLNIDSLLYNLHLIELSDDSLLNKLLNDSSGRRSLHLLDSIISDTTEAYQKAEAARKAEEAAKAQHIADSIAQIKKVDPFRPPAGQTNFYTYHLFTADQPRDIKPLKSFPKQLLGTYYNTTDRNIEIQITTETLIYRTDKQEILFLIGSNQVIKEDKGVYFMNYKVTVDSAPFWVVDRVTIENDTLYFRTISPNDMSKNPSKKEMRNYIEENNTPIINSFVKLTK